MFYILQLSEILCISMYYPTIFLYIEGGGFKRRMLIDIFLGNCKLFLAAWRKIGRTRPSLSRHVEEDWEDMDLFMKTCGGRLGGHGPLYHDMWRKIGRTWTSL